MEAFRSYFRHPQPAANENAQQHDTGHVGGIDPTNAEQNNQANFEPATQNMRAANRNNRLPGVSDKDFVELGADFSGILSKQIQYAVEHPNQENNLYDQAIGDCGLLFAEDKHINAIKHFVDLIATSSNKQERFLPSAQVALSAIRLQLERNHVPVKISSLNGFWKKIVSLTKEGAFLAGLQVANLFFKVTSISVQRAVLTRLAPFIMRIMTHILAKEIGLPANEAHMDNQILMQKMIDFMHQSLENVAKKEPHEVTQIALRLFGALDVTCPAAANHLVVEVTPEQISTLWRMTANLVHASDGGIVFKAQNTSTPEEQADLQARSEADLLFGEEKQNALNQLTKPTFTIALTEANNPLIDSRLLIGAQLLDDQNLILPDGKIIGPTCVGQDRIIYDQALGLAEETKLERTEHRTESMVKVIKQNIPFFINLFSSEYPDAVFATLLKKAALPEELKELVEKETNFLFENKELRGLLKGVLSPRPNEDITTLTTAIEQIIDLMPMNYADHIATTFNHALGIFNPSALPFFQQFRHELLASLPNLQAMKDISEILTDKYYGAIPLNEKRRMSVEILQLGTPELDENNNITAPSMTALIRAVLVSGGVLLQKGLQLVGGEVKHPAMQAALKTAKDKIPAESQAWATGAYQQRLDTMNNDLKIKAIDDFRVGGEGIYTQLEITDFEATHLSAATVGQVHSAKLTERKYCINHANVDAGHAVLLLQENTLNNINQQNRARALACLEAGRSSEWTNFRLVQAEHGPVIIERRQKIDAQNRQEINDETLFEHEIAQEKQIILKLRRPNVMQRVAYEKSGLLSIPGLSASATSTLEDLAGNIIEECDFKQEYDNGKEMETIYPRRLEKEADEIPNLLHLKTISSFIEKADPIGKYLPDWLKPNLFSFFKSDAGAKVKLKVAHIHYASEDMLIEDFVAGKSITKVLEGLRAAPLSERIEGTYKSGTAVNMLVRAWLGSAIRDGFLAGDVHDGNALFNLKSAENEDSEYNLIDFGAATVLSESQRNAMIQMVAAIMTGQEKTVFNALKELLRADDETSGKLGSPNAASTAIERNEDVICAELKRAISWPNLSEQRDHLLSFLKSKNIIKADTTREAFEACVSDAKLKLILNNKNLDRAAIVLDARLESLKPEIRQINPHNPTPTSTILISDYLKTTSHYRVFHFFQPKGSERSMFSNPISLGNAHNELYFINSMFAFANILAKHGIGATSSIAQFNRGAQFLVSLMNKVNDFKVETKRSNTNLTSPQIKKLEPTAIGDQFLWSLLPEAYNLAGKVAWEALSSLWKTREELS